MSLKLLVLNFRVVGLPKGKWRQLANMQCLKRKWKGKVERSIIMKLISGIKDLSGSKTNVALRI